MIDLDLAYCRAGGRSPMTYAAKMFTIYERDADYCRAILMGVTDNYELDSGYLAQVRDNIATLALVARWFDAIAYMPATLKRARKALRKAARGRL